jgi:magnesium chelatase subunit D
MRQSAGSKDARPDPVAKATGGAQSLRGGGGAGATVVRGASATSHVAGSVPDSPAPGVAADGAVRWSDALLAAALFCVDPQGTGGVRLRSGAGPVRDAWFELLRQCLGDTPLRRVPAQVDEARLVGGIDLTATLRAGRPIAEQGLLASNDGAVLVVPMAERMRPVTAALMAAVLDEGVLRVERDGFSALVPARIAVIACDEGIPADEQPPTCLIDRLAFWLDVDTLQWRDIAMGNALDGAPSAADIHAARARLAAVQVPAAVCEALCGACAALGIHSLRIPLLALRVARAAAAFAGDGAVAREHAALAARLVIAPRARQLPPPAPAPDDAQQDPDEDQLDDPQDEDGDAEPEDDTQQAPATQDAQSQPQPPEPADAAATSPDAREMAEVVLDAARAVLPADLLADISRGAARPTAGAVAGRTGVQVRSRLRGRPVGVRRGELRDGARLHVLETLRAAAPWQAVRQRALAHAAGAPVQRGRIQVRREDFRLVRFSQRTQTTVIFCVDASGSAALSRLAEAKGAVELFLADCYVRRDQVALIAFRGRDAQLLLPPTRSLARARRSLAGVPGGGGTPVAAGLRLAASVADAARRRGDVPLLVLLTDGKANVALDGTGGRDRANQDALAMARLLRATAVRGLLVDFSQRAQTEAQVLAQAMGARYLPLPRADAALVAGVVRAARQDLP